MTYGWAILVVLAAIGALAYFGVLSPDKFLPDKCSAAPPFSCTQYKLTGGTTNNVALALSANSGVDITLATLNLSCDGLNDYAAVTVAPTIGTVIPNGNSISVTWNAFAGTAATGGCSALTTGNKFKATYKMTYQKAGETVWHTSTGSIQARVE